MLVRHLSSKYLYTPRIGVFLADPRLDGKVLVNRVWRAPAYIHYMTLHSKPIITEWDDWSLSKKLVAKTSVTISGSAHALWEVAARETPESLCESRKPQGPGGRTLTRPPGFTARW